jgi:hypothetical protein
MEDKTVQEQAQDIMEEVADGIGQPFDVRIEDNVMLISPAEAGIALFGMFAGRAEQEDQAWAEVEALAVRLEAVRDENAMFRDLFEEVHPVIMSFGYEDLANRLMGAMYPVRYIETEDGQ